MQTFLPSADFAESARMLDMRRLGKQRVEAMQIASVVMHRGGHGGWCNHPAALMWLQTPDALLRYQRAICNEWSTVRGYRDTCYEKTLMIIGAEADPTQPQWLGWDEVHASHRSNLLRKADEYFVKHSGKHLCHEPGGCDPERMRDWYGQFGWTEPHDLPYVWPVKRATP